MDRIEAKWILLRTLVDYQRMAHAKLRDLVGETMCFEVAARSGAQYQVDVLLLWDEKPEGDIRILASIDDGGWRTCCPLSYGTLVSPQTPATA